MWGHGKGDKSHIESHTTHIGAVYHQPKHCNGSFRNLSWCAQDTIVCTNVLVFVPPMKSNSSPRLAAEVPRSSVVSQSTVNNCNNCATIVSMIPTTTMAPLQSHSPVQGWVLSEAKSKASNIAQLGYPRYPDPFQKLDLKTPSSGSLVSKQKICSIALQDWYWGLV